MCPTVVEGIWFVHGRGNVIPVGTGVPDGPLHQTINFCKDWSVIFLFFVYIIIFEMYNLSRTVGDAGPYNCLVE